MPNFEYRTPLGVNRPASPVTHYSTGGFALLGLLIFLAASVLGCRLSEPSSASFASVEIREKPTEVIEEVTRDVFAEEGFRFRGGGSGALVFQKEGSQGDAIVYQGLIGAHEGERTDIRVRVRLVELGEEAIRLQCQAYMVKNAGDSFFEDEVRLTNLRAGPYQKILREIASRLE